MISSSSGLHFSSSDRLLDDVEVYEGSFENEGAPRLGDEGAEEGRDVGARISYPAVAYLDFRIDDDRG